jgi:hypothetical protein
VLLEQVERGNVLLFIGERIVRDANGQVVIDQLATKLASRCGANHPEAYTFAEAAQACEDEKGRYELVQFVRDEIERLGDEPQRIHRLIARLTQCQVWVTTCFDSRLERACAEIGRPLQPITGKIEVAFDDDQKTRLYKLRGSVERVESLILTEEDYERFFEEHASISVVLRAYLASKTVLFIGYDLADPQFRNLYRRVTDLLDNYARRAYAFGETPALRVARWCKRHGIEVVEVGATEFLEALLAQLASRVKAEPDAVPPRLVEPATALPLPERPYKLLAHYEPGDAKIFFGREQEIQTLTSLIHAHRLVLLYGISGTGKTSLLLAGVVPRLGQADPIYTTLYVRGRSEPARMIRDRVRRLLPAADLPQSSSLVDFLMAATVALARPLVIFLDQFEEFFIHTDDPQSRQEFLTELGDLYNAADVPVKIVFTLREEWFAFMSELESDIPEIYRVKLRLLPLSRTQASQAITQPAQQLGIDYAPELVERLLDDLAGIKVDGESTSIMPPQLQLACSALYERARSQRRSWITIEDYVTVGETEGILARYIEEALREFPGEQRELAKTVLMTLVSAQATRTWATLDDIAVRTGAAVETVETVLARLMRQWLVRRLEDDKSYELTHDVLAATIADWIGDEDRQIKQIQEMLRRELADWQQDFTVFPSQSKFQRINSLRDQLRLTDDETALLLRTALLYDEEIAYWLAQIKRPDDQVAILMTMLKGEAQQARRTAAVVLAAFPHESVTQELATVALTDPDPDVREMAAISLGRMGSRSGIERLTNNLLTGKNGEQDRAVRALAIIQDVAPVHSPTIPFPLWRPIYVELAKLRFLRQWPQIRMVTAVGAVAGVVGFALTLTPLLALQWFATFRRSEQVIQDLLFIVFFSALLGLIAGSGLAFGISVGKALVSEHITIGRMLGGALLGGVSFAIALFPLQSVPGGMLLGALAGFGITSPLLVNRRRSAQLIGGMVGAALGLLLFVNFYDPKLLSPAGSIMMLVMAGGVSGLIMAFAIGWAEARWPGEGIKPVQVLRWEEIAPEERDPA